MQSGDQYNARNVHFRDGVSCTYRFDALKSWRRLLRRADIKYHTPRLPLLRMIKRECEKLRGQWLHNDGDRSSIRPR